MDYGPQFLYCSESEWGKFVSYNNIRDRPTDFRSDENDVSCLTELIILKCHLFVLHSGAKDTLNELRCNY